MPIGIAGMLFVWFRMPDYREANARPLDVLGMILFSSGIALLSYVLEVFGEHRLGAGGILGLLAISLLLLFGYGLHAARTAFPLLHLTLFRIRTFFTAVSGSFITRLGIGGAPFLLPLLYQVGLGLTPVQSGLLIMPQALASMSTKFLLPRILARFGYRSVLVCNTLALGVLLMLFGTIGPATPVWLIVLQALCYGMLDVVAVHQHEHPGLCRRAARPDQRRQHHRQHAAATVGQLRRGGGGPDDGVFPAGGNDGQPAPDDRRPAQGVLAAGRLYPGVDPGLRPAETRRRRCRRRQRPAHRRSQGLNYQAVHLCLASHSAVRSASPSLSVPGTSIFHVPLGR
ncbi:MAG: hypothetical protein WDN06_06400 [Asticcacaulis sp.]